MTPHGPPGAWGPRFIEPPEHPVSTPLSVVVVVVVVSVQVRVRVRLSYDCPD